jgi:hypothetical protein
MTFAKKFLDITGEAKTIEVSVSQIEAAILTYLSAVKAVKYDPYNVYTINLDDIVGKKSTDVIKVGIKVSRETGNGKEM